MSSKMKRRNSSVSIPSIAASIANRKPVLLATRSSTWFITATVCTAIFTDIFLYAVIVPVFPFSLRDRVGIPEDEVQHWLSVLLAVYAAGLLAGAPVCGILADRIKYRRWPLLFGLAAVGASTVMLCVAKSIALLVVGRLLQGIAASIIWVVGLALLADTVSKDEIAKSLGYVGTALSLGTLTAPLLGGIVYKEAGYYAVFGMCFGVIALDVVFRLTLIEKKEAQRWLSQEDKMSELGSPVEEPACIEKDASPDLVGGMVPTADPALAEPTRKRRMPPILLLCASPRVLAATWGTVVVATLMCALDTTLTIFVERTFGFNSLQAALVFLAPLTPAFFGPVIGIFVDKFGARYISAGGFLLMLPPWTLLRLVTHDDLCQKVVLCALLALIGVGCAVGITGLMAEFTKVCDEKERETPGIFGENGAYAQSYGIFNIAWATGSLIGAFWSGGVYTEAGWGTMGWSLGLLSAITAVPILLFTDGWLGRRKRNLP